MVGYLYEGPGWLRVKTAPVRLHGLALLGAELPRAGFPAGSLLRRLDRGAKALQRAGCRRVLARPGLDGPELSDILERRGLAPVDPLPLCRAKGAELALALVETLPLRRRCILLRGNGAWEAWPIAAALCPQVGTLLLDFLRGEEELERRLRSVYGAACLTPDQGPKPQAAVELSPVESSAARRVLKLWGAPELCGLTLAAGEETPPLPLLELLWETGRVAAEQVRVRRAEEP